MVDLTNEPATSQASQASAKHHTSPLFIVTVAFCPFLRPPVVLEPEVPPIVNVTSVSSYAATIFVNDGKSYVEPAAVY